MEFRERFANVVQALDGLERQALSLRFGLEDGRSHTLDEVATLLGVEREAIRLMEAKVLRRVREDPDQ
jgi:RNA polymerase primary sigma factor